MSIAVIGLVGRSIFMEVPRFHEGGETVHATSLHEEWGGKGFNQAVTVARQGCDVDFLGAIHEDDQASLAAFEQKEDHLRLSVVLTRKPTATAAILTNPQGETRVTVYPGATLEPGDVDAFEPAIKKADFLLLNNEVPEAVNLRAVDIARRHRTRILFNPAPARPLPEAIRTAVYLFTPNEFEVSALGDRVGKSVVMTLGARGCRIDATGEVIPAPSYGTVVDTTGAGDVFNGVLAVRLAAGDTLSAACAAANSAAAQSVTRHFVLPSIPKVGGLA